MAPFAITQHLRGPNVVFCMKIVKKMLKIGDFQHFFNFFFNIFFSTFFAFLGSPGTKENFIFLVKSQFFLCFGLQKGKCDMQKMTFGPLSCCVIAYGAIYSYGQKAYLDVMSLKEARMIFRDGK